MIIAKNVNGGQETILKTHSLITSLKSLKGNAHGCVYTEPLSGIPYNLYAPYISVYMIALGLSDKQIGLIVSISLGFQILFGLLSGVITDKMGRRRTTLVFDILSWSISALISAIAQNIWYFLGAGIISSVCQVTYNSWDCLMVEDSDPDQLVDIYSLVYTAGLLAAFFAPVAGLLIKSFSLVPTMRGLYLFASIMFTVKCIATYKMTTETEQGKVRMHETKHQSVISVLREYRVVFREVLHTPPTLYTAGILVILSICMMINGNFWSIIVTEKLHIPVQDLAIFTFVKSMVMLLIFFIVIPRMRALHFKIPLMLGFIGFVVSQLVLIVVHEKGYWLLLVSILLEACSVATVSPLVDRLRVMTINPKERARIQSILLVGIIFITSPFGWIAGTLSMINKSLPFILNITLFLVAMVLSYLAGQASKNKTGVSAAATDAVPS